jgi:branched-chain amino acid transport system permease protein
VRKTFPFGADAAVWGAGAVALLAYACFFAGPYALRLLTVAGAYAVAVIGYQVIFGLCGALSLAQGAFFGVGAYVSGVLALTYGWDFTVTAPLAMLFPAFIAVLVGSAVLRLDSHYFALATLGVAQIALLAVVNGPEGLGGANGLPGVPGLVLFGEPLPRGLPAAALTWGLVAAAGLGLAVLTRSRFGRSLELLRDDPLTAACLGLDVARLRLTAFVLSAACAGLGGALAVHAQRVVSPEVLEFPVMVAVLTMAVVGGRGRATGAVIGALAVTWLPESLGGLGQARLLFYGLALLAAVVLLPEGLIGALAGLKRRSAAPVPSRPFAAPVPAPAPAAVPPPRRYAGLRVAGLRKAFGGVCAVDEVSFDIKPGEATGLIGPNGSGKTTLINLLSGVDRADAGLILLGDQAVPGASHERARAGLARTFQTPAAPAGVCILDAVAAAGYADGLSAARARLAASPLLTAAGLGEMAELPLCDAPPGIRRRVDLLRALARRPSVLLLDEPAAGLTREEREQTAALIRAATAAGTTVLLVEHDMGFLTPLCRRVLCLDRGRLIYNGSATGLHDDAAVRAAYFGGASPVAG